MKTLKFKSYLAQRILSGEKTGTWRLFDDKDLQVGDELEFFDSETKEKFGNAKIITLVEKTLGTLTDEDWKGHERYGSEEAMYEHFKAYYGDKVGLDTPLKIIHFDFTPIKGLTA